MGQEGRSSSAVNWYQQNTLKYSWDGLIIQAQIGVEPHGVYAEVHVGKGTHYKWHQPGHSNWQWHDMNTRLQADGVSLYCV